MRRRVVVTGLGAVAPSRARRRRPCGPQPSPGAPESTGSRPSTRGASPFASPAEVTGFDPGGRRRQGGAAARAQRPARYTAAKEAWCGRGRAFDPRGSASSSGRRSAASPGSRRSTTSCASAAGARLAVLPPERPRRLRERAIAIELGIRGPNYAPVSACATGSHAVGEAAELDPARRRRRRSSPAAPSRASTRSCSRASARCAGSSPRRRIRRSPRAPSTRRARGS